MPTILPNPGDTIRYTITVEQSGTTNADGVVFNDTIDTNTTLGNVGITVPAGSGVLVNDNDPDGTTPTLTVVAAAGRLCFHCRHYRDHCATVQQRAAGHRRRAADRHHHQR